MVELKAENISKKIKKNIINYMEGGTDSFNHKIKIYKNVL